MKNFLFFIVPLALCVGACGKSAQEAEAELEEARADSILRADSLARLDSLDRAIAQVRLDMERRNDSIARVERVLSRLPAFADVIDSKDRGALFRSLGYEVTTRNEYNDQLEENIEYIIATNRPEAGYTFVFDENATGFSFTVVGVPEFLDSFLFDAEEWIRRQKRQFPDDQFILSWNAVRSGDTVIVNMGGD